MEKQKELLYASLKMDVESGLSLTPEEQAFFDEATTEMMKSRLSEPELLDLFED